MTKWDDLAKSLKEGVDTVVEKTEELTRMGKIRVEIINLNRQIEKLFADLGGKAYHLMVDEQKRQISGNPEVKDCIARIKELEEKLKLKEAELENVKSKEEESKEVVAD